MSRLALSLFIVAAAAPIASAGGPTPIIGGTPATKGEFPGVVAITIGGDLCSGTLIDPSWVLTAAHCLTPVVLMLPDQATVTMDTKVHLNTINVFQDSGTGVNAMETFPDPMFNINDLGSHDSGLIHLVTPVTDVAPYKINFDPTMAPVGVSVTMVGFGATEVGAMGDVGVEFTVMQTSIPCNSEIGSDANLLCFSQTSGKGKCEGDSGGPSFATVGTELLEVGITSFGDQTCAQFGADTRVDAEKDFILSHVPQLMCSMDSDCGNNEQICFDNKCIAMPFGPKGLGSSCTTGADCDSGQCAVGPGGMKCSMSCTVGMADACPMGLTCQGSTGSSGACWPPDASSGGGCCDASGHGAPTALLGIGIVGLVLRRRRR